MNETRTASIVKMRERENERSRMKLLQIPFKKCFILNDDLCLAQGNLHKKYFTSHPG